MAQEGNDLEGGSCLSATSCLAVGTSGRIVSWNGTSWANVSHGLTTNTLRRVHCASENYCVAVGFGGVVLRRVDGTWGTQSSGTTNDLFGIHCVNANFCVAVGLNEIRIWNGTDWRNPAGDLGATGSPFNSTSWRGVSCTSASLCTVVGLEGSSGAQVGAVGGFDGTRWARHMPSAGRWLIDISCTTGPLFCMTASGKTFRGTR
jgi:hypothetical protein